MKFVICLMLSLLLGLPNVMARAFDYHCSRELLSFPEIAQFQQFKHSEKPISIFDKANHECWIRFQVVNRSPGVQEYYFQNLQPVVNAMEFYQGGESSVRIGMDHPFVERPLPYLLPSFRFTALPGENTYFVRFFSQHPIWINFQISDKKEFLEASYFEQFVQGGFIILCLGFAVINLISFVINRSRESLYYATYLVGFLVSQMFLGGTLQQYIAPQSTNSILIGFGGVSLGVVSMNLFLNRFLNLREYLPWSTYVVTSIIILAVLAFAIGVLGYEWHAALLNNIVLIYSTPYFLYFGFRLSARGMRSAKFFTVGWMFMSLGLVGYIMTSVGLIPTNMWTTKIHLFGAVMEIIFVSAAIADAMKQAQKKIIVEREHAFNQLKKMVYPHQLERIKLGHSLESTMPCRSQESIVICFDVVGSSKIRCSGVKDFLSRVFQTCHELIASRYRFSPLSSSGFRIKEMGDGFLCSVGFPFAVPEGVKAEHLAFDLAQGFVHTFEEEAVKFGYHEKLLCSIGIATGKVESYFTVSGTVHYELFGEAIILATRYEGLRKSFPIQNSNHLITIQNKVADRLPKAEKKVLNLYRFDPKVDRIRDDPDATSFYYMNISASNDSFRDAS